jgi:RNA polymerase sigma factor (sigma-70 family)
MTTADAGDTAFETFYRAEINALTGWLTKQLADPADAADVTQIAFTQLWRHWRQVDKPHSYLYQVARHELARIWSNRRDTRRLLASGSAAGQTADAIPARLQVLTVRDRLLALPGRQRAVVAGYYDGYRAPELTAALDMPATTIRSNHRHAREHLDKLGAVLEQDPRGLMLRRAYADMRDGDPRPPGSRPVIAESWARSAARLADPSHGPTVPPLTGEDLAVRRTATPLAGIAPAACADLAGSTGLLTVVTDAEGWVLWRSGLTNASPHDKGPR